MVPEFRQSYERNLKNNIRRLKRHRTASFQERYKRKKISCRFDCQGDGSYCMGYFVKLGKDGKPMVRKFGNVDSSPLFLGGGLTVK
jgi:hypothetical protein